MYKWALKGIVEKPIYVPSNCFQFKETKGIHPIGFPSGIITILSKAHLLTKIPEKLYIAEANIRNVKGSVIVNKNGKYIGLGCWDFIWIEKEYRGFGLSIEISAEDILNTIDRFISMGGSSAYHMNKAGVSLVSKAHKLLLERGAITHEKSI